MGLLPGYLKRFRYVRRKVYAYSTNEITLKKELVSKGIADVEAYWTAQSNVRRDAFGADKLY